MTTIVRAIQKLIINTFHAMNLTRVLIGTVETLNPLQIRIDSKLLLKEEHLYLTKNVMDYDLLMKHEDHETEEIGNHTHTLPGETPPKTTGLDGGHKHVWKATGTEDDFNSKYTILNHLNINDTVLLLQQQGGQKYVILDKVYPAKKEEE